MKKLMLFCLSLLLLFTISSCVVQERIIYKDVPADSMIIKRDTLDKLINETIQTKRELLECLEREKN